MPHTAAVMLKTSFRRVLPPGTGSGVEVGGGGDNNNAISGGGGGGGGGEEDVQEYAVYTERRTAHNASQAKKTAAASVPKLTLKLAAGKVICEPSFVVMSDSLNRSLRTRLTNGAAELNGAVGVTNSPIDYIYISDDDEGGKNSAPVKPDAMTTTVVSENDVPLKMCG